MLTLKIGNSLVDTRNLEIPVVLRNPVLNDGKGSFIFSFSLPATPMLKDEFGYLHRPSSNIDPFVTKPLELSYGSLKFKGTAKVTSADDETYEVSCPIDSGELAKIFKSLKMADVDMGGVRQANIGDISIKATETSEIELDLTNTTDIEYIDISFNDVDVNNDLMLQSSGSEIVADADCEVVILIKFEITKEWGYVYLELLLNDTVISTTVLETGAVSYSQSISVLSGDVITYRIKANPQNDGDGHNFLRFTIPAGMTLDAYKQGSLNDNLGLALYPGNDYACFPVENPKFFDNVDDDTYAIDHISIKETYSKYFPILNYYRDNSFPLLLLGESEGESFMAFNMFCPFPYLAYFIKRMAITLGIEIENNVFEHNQLKQLVIFNAFAENNFISNDLIKPNPGFDLKDHLPDSLLSEYWKDLCKLLGIAWDYNSTKSKLRLKNLEEIATDTEFINFPGIITRRPELMASAYNGYKLTQDTSGDGYISDNFKSLEGLNYLGSVNSYISLPYHNNSINDCYFVVANKAFYVWNYDKETSSIMWIFHSNNFQFTLEETDDNIDGPTFEISTKINALMLNGYPFTDNQLGSSRPGWMIPKTAQAGNFDGLQNIFKASFSKSLLFYRGLRYDGQGNLYPLGTFDVYDYLGNVITFESQDPELAYTADLSLRWDGPYGLFEKRYKNWINLKMKSRGEWEFFASLTAQQISEIDFFKWYLVLNHPFLIKEMRFNIYHDRVSPVIIRGIAR